ncbi:MAG: glycosyltransferase family 2 protein [Marinosulfonomonas sp.]
MSDLLSARLASSSNIAESETPRVSVIMANFNGAAHLSESLSSVLSQTVQDIEVIVVDDASTDESPDIAESIAKTDSRVKVHRAVNNGGPGAARNRGIDVATGEWIAVVDGDDLLHPKRFEYLLNMAELHQADAVADDLIYFEAGQNATGKTLLGKNAPDDAKLVTINEILVAETTTGANSLGYLKPIFRRSALGNQRYRKDIRIGEDLEFYMRFVLSGAKFVLTSQSYYLYRQHTNSLSRTLSTDDLDMMIRVQCDLQDDHRYLSETVNDLFDQRRANLETALEFGKLAKNLKSGMLFSALGRGLKTPKTLPMLARAFSEHMAKRQSKPVVPTASDSEIVLLSKTQSLTDFPHEVGSPKVLWIPDDPQDWAACDWAKITACTSLPDQKVYAKGRAGVGALGFVPVWKSAMLVPDQDGWDAETTATIEAAFLGQDNAETDVASPAPVLLDKRVTKLNAAARPAPAMATDSTPLVHIRTPTYNRPEALHRCILSLQTQSHENWICDVFDDSPDQTGRKVVEDLGDPRVRYVHNSIRKYASKNIDNCFSSQNPHDADYFCVVEDDNLIMPSFLEENIGLCKSESVEVVFRNQLVELKSGTNDARLSDHGILDNKLTERTYTPDMLRMTLLADIGVSNGGLFWSRNAKTDFEIHHDCSATLQEYLRTFAIVDPVFVALQPLAVWAENGEDTTRDQGADLGWFKRELSLKRSVQVLQSLTWKMASREQRRNFMNDPAFSYPKDMRAQGLLKSHLRFDVGSALPMRKKMHLLYRGLLIKVLGKKEPGLDRFLQDRATGA